METAPPHAAHPESDLSLTSPRRQRGPGPVLLDGSAVLAPPPRPAPMVAPPPDLLHEMVATGRMSEAAMLDLLATRYRSERIDLGLTPPDPTLADLLPPTLCLRHAVVPWRRQGGQVIVATALPETMERLDRLLPAGLGPVRAVLAPRAQVQAHVARAHRAALCAGMAARTPRADSFRGLGPARVGLGLVLCALALITFAALFPTAGAALLLGWITATLLAAIALKLSAAAVQLRHDRRAGRRPPPVPPPTELPRISILVPLYHEPRVAETLMHRLDQLIYPRGRLEVLLVLEETDRVTARALRKATLPPWCRIVTVPDGKPRTKPRAMNYALDFCRGEIIGVYDAEDAPDPDQLLQVAAHFAAAPPEVACLQGALDYYNPVENWIARCFTIEYNTWFRLILPGMARLGLGVPLGGTTLFVRRAVLESVGGWDAHNVTEDADLGFRLARHGWQTQVIDTTTGEEANHRALPWIRQRSRWHKGYMVTYLVHMRRPRALLRGLGWRAVLGFHAHFLSTLTQFLLAPVLWSFWLLAAGLTHPLETWLPSAAVYACAVLFLASGLLNGALFILGTRRPEHRHLWPWIPATLLYFPMATLAAYKALAELVFAPAYWDKTPHGVTRAAPHLHRPVPQTAPRRAAPAPRALPVGPVMAAQSTSAAPPESSFSRVT